MARVTELFQSPLFLVKIVELVASILSIALVTDVGPIATNYNKLAVVYGTLIGFIMISIITILGSFIDNGLHRTLILVISLPAAFLFCAAGAFMIEAWDIGTTVSARVLGSGIVAFANGLVYLVDIALTYFRYG